MSEEPATPSRDVDDSAEAQALIRVVEALTSQFPAVPAEVITAKVHQAMGEFDGAPIREFVPVLVERHVRADLIAPA